MWKVTNQGANEAEILLYDIISDFDDEDWGITSAKALINKIKALGSVSNITLRINSVGGDVFEAQAMYSYLKSHPANITVRVDGIAASAASLVAMAGNKIVMPSNALMMIHNPAGAVWGEADDMREQAEILDKIRDSIANVYISRTGLDREKVISMMDGETWMDASEAHDLKFCDEIEEAVTVTAMAVNGGTIFRSGFGFSRIDEILTAKLPKNFAPINASLKAKSNLKEEKNEMAITNVAELEKTYPAIIEEIKNTADEAGYNRGVQAERERLKTLDSLNAPGREAVIAKAKYEEPKDARDIAIELLQTDKNSMALAAMGQDASVINPALMPQKTTPDDSAEEARIIDMIASNINSIRGLA